MKKNIYYTRRSYERYDAEHFIIYLNEKVIENHTELKEDGKESEPRTAYEYQGTENDGGTIVQCSEATRDNLIDAIIRSRYSQSQENAIKTHRLQVIAQEVDNKAKQSELSKEWEAFNQWRESAKQQVDSWLNN